MNTRTRTIAAAIAAAAILPLAACGTDGTATIADTPLAETTAAATTPDPETIDTAFLAVLRKHGIPASDTAIEAARSTCDALDAGNSITDILTIAVTNLGTDGGYFIGASVATYCPEYSADIDALVGDPA